MAMTDARSETVGKSYDGVEGEARHKNINELAISYVMHER